MSDLPQIKDLRNVTVEEYKRLPETYRRLYHPDGRNGYKLDAGNAAPLQNALSRTRSELKKWQEGYKKLQQQQAAIPRAERRKAEDFAQLERASRLAVQKERQALAAERKRFADYKRNQEVNALVHKASSVFRDPELMQPYVRGKIGYAVIDGKGSPYFKDEQGNRTTLTVDEFRESLRKNDKLKDYVKASSASGSGAPQHSEVRVPVSDVGNAASKPRSGVVLAKRDDVKARVE